MVRTHQHRHKMNGSKSNCGILLCLVTILVLILPGRSTIVIAQTLTQVRCRQTFLFYLAVELGQHSLAFVEYTRVKGFDEFDPNGDCAYLFGMELLRYGRTALSLRPLWDSVAKSQDKQTRDTRDLVLCSALIRAGKHIEAVHRLARLEILADIGKVRHRAHNLRCVAHLQAGEGEAAKKCLEEAGVLSKLPELTRKQVLARLSMLRKGSKTMNWIVGISSAIIPGSGQLIAGFPEKALAALLGNSLCIYPTYWLMSHGYVLEGSMFGAGFCIRYYVGNILKAAKLWEERETKRDRNLMESILKQTVDVLDETSR